MKSNHLSLRSIIAFDAATCLAMAAALMLATETIAGLLRLPPGLLIGAAGILLPVSAFMAFAASRAAIPRWAAWAIIAGNLAWVVASLALAFGPFLSPSPLGVGFIVVQAAAVAALAVLEHRATASHANGGVSTHQRMAH